MRFGIVLVVAAACSGERARPDAAARDIDAAGGICDCWDGVSCRDGTVTTTYGSDECVDDTPFGCQESEHPCASGCDVERAAFDEGGYIPPAHVLCAETPAKVAGDACSLGDPCLPTRAVDQGDGTVAQIYLACEGAVCVEAAAPVVDGWLAPCEAITPTPGFEGWVVDGDGYCLVDEPCTARTIQCDGDWECPAGASCDDSLTTPEGYALGICRPGPRGAPISLDC